MRDNTNLVPSLLALCEVIKTLFTSFYIRYAYASAKIFPNLNTYRLASNIRLKLLHNGESATIPQRGGPTQAITPQFNEQLPLFQVINRCIRCREIAYSQKL